MTGPAFAAVEARRTLAGPQGPAPPPPNMAWPQSCRAWTSQAFAEDNQVPGITRAELESKLKQIITEAKLSNQLWDIVWEKHPLPQHIILQERAASAQQERTSYVAPGVDQQLTGYANGSGFSYPQHPVNDTYSGAQSMVNNAYPNFQPPVNNAYPRPPSQANDAYGSSQLMVNNTFSNQHQANHSFSHTSYPASTQSQPGVQSRKRKSGYDSHDSDSGAPWRNGAKATKTCPQEMRAGNKNKKQEKRERQRQRANERLYVTSKFQEDLEKRRQRFNNGASASQSPKVTSGTDTPAHIGPIVGQSQSLEKRFFRLTAPAKPEEVRPQAVLEKTMELLKRKWKEERNYNYICDQLKSMRQDVTVQHLQNSFTVEVYELHARIALEMSDLGEYKQCQSRLKELHKMKLGGNTAEFLAYRVLYVLYTLNRSEMNDLLAEMEPDDRKEPAVQHALAVGSALNRGDYRRFFKLSLDAPNLGGYLIDQFIKRERVAALTNICTAYRPHVNLKFITEELGFESHQQTYDFIREHVHAEVLKDALKETADSYLLITKEALPSVRAARSYAFRSVDIKGPI